MRRLFRGGSAQPWHDAEMNVMQGGMRRELIDAYRALHSYGRRSSAGLFGAGQQGSAVASITPSAHRT
jgi:hypothetical protein